MPTENRSSNTEMVSELQPCPFCGTAMHVESNRDWHRVMGDHAEECVFTDSETMMVPATDEQRSLMANDWNRRAMPAEQHQGEPVAVLYANGTVLTKTDCGDVFDICCKVETPLYTHADHSEVERLSQIIRDLNEERDGLGADAGRLRAQLAEQDALLRDAALHASWMEPNSAAVLKRIKAVLSASAETTVPIAWHVGGNGYDRICFEHPGDLAGGPCIQPIHDLHRLIGVFNRYSLKAE